MDINTLIKTRRTVHNYRPETVSEELIRDALALSLWAPNHKKTFPWVYVSVGPRARAKLADLSVELKSQNEVLSDMKMKALRDNLLNPAALIVLGVNKNADARRYHEDYATLSCSVQIASLALWQNGIGSKWSTGGALMHAKTYSILDIDPNLVQLEGGLMIGVPANIPPVPERPALDKFLRTVG